MFVWNCAITYNTQRDRTGWVRAVVNQHPAAVVRGRMNLDALIGTPLLGSLHVSSMSFVVIALIRSMPTNRASYS